MSLKIMVADDDRESLKVMRILTASLGHTVVTFEDRRQAEERVEKQRFDVVFLGMRLPELDGLELARRIRNSETNRETTIVMLNATEDIVSLRKAFGEGADFVLTKPVSAGRLHPMLAAMEAPKWKEKRSAARLPLFTEVICKRGEQEFSLRSLNISESGVLLQPGLEAEVGEEVSLKFNLAEVRASLNVHVRIIRKDGTRKDGTERVGTEFIGLAPEDVNAIQLYVMGRLNNERASQERAESRSIWMGQGFLREP